MRRVMMALLATTMGTVLLVSLKTQGLGAPLGLSAEAPLDPAAPGADPAASALGAGPTGPAGTTLPGTTPKPGQPPAPTGGVTTLPGPTSTAGGPRPTVTAPTTTKTTTAPPPTSATFTGTAVAVKTAQSPSTKSSPCGECHDYSIAVTITVAGGKITKATAAYNPSPGGSLSYANRASNSLSQSVLTAQTWNLGRVSGATYAANAWELSVKSAMSKAGLPV